MANSSFHDTVANFREYDAPLPTKLRLALSNTLIKLRTRSSCCGHLGQPGCWQRAVGPREGPSDQHHHDRWRVTSYACAGSGASPSW